MGDASEMSQMSMETSQVASSVTTSGSDRLARRENKRMIVRIGVVVIILLLIIDIILLYLWLTAEPKVIRKTVRKKAGEESLFDQGLGPEDSDGSLLFLDDLTYSGMDSAEGRHRQALCNSSGCIWLKAYLRSGGRGGDGSSVHFHSHSRPDPCDDFHGHVCGTRRYSVYEDAVARLMTAVAARIVGTPGGRVAPGSESVRAESAAIRDPDNGHVALLERCLQGAAIVSKDDVARTCRGREDEPCPLSLPDAPLRFSEDFFREHPNASVDNFSAFVQSVAPNLNLESRLHLRETGAHGAFPKHWIPQACRWVELSARCHLESRLRSNGYGKLTLYQLLWKLLYFAPFMGSQAVPLVRKAYREPPKPQLQACLQIVEDVFRRRMAVEAHATLLGAVDGLHDTVAHFVWEARQAMRNLVPTWLSRAYGNWTGDVIDDAAERDLAKELAAQQLSAIEALVDEDSSPARPNKSIYCWQVRFREDRKALLVPPGLLGLFLDASAVVEPVLVPLLGRPLLRELMPTRQGPYAWRMRNERRLDALVNCVAPSLDVSGPPQDSRGLAMETVLESGVLEPLLMLYSRRLREEAVRPVQLHPDYSNAELFFVIWALGHCGGRNAGVLVNGTLRNFAPFARAFRCTVNQAMWSGHRCPFWH